MGSDQDSVILVDKYGAAREPVHAGSLSVS